jgi:hypothetical protein
VGRKANDLTGRVFEKLKVLERDGNTRPTRWICQCECGTIKSIIGQSLLNGCSTSCGCVRKEKIIGCSTKHGKCGTKLYECLKNMKKRCYNPNHPRYEHWGGRGITICDEWLNEENGVLNFYNWAMTNGYQEGLSIDRINNDGNYEPSNCRWTDSYTQRMNQRPRQKKVKIKERTPKDEYIDFLKEKYKDRKEGQSGYKLSVSDVKEIKTGLQLKIKGSELARIFKVSRQTINYIKHGQLFTEIDI